MLIGESTPIQQLCDRLTKAGIPTTIGEKHVSEIVKIYGEKTGTPEVDSIGLISDLVHEVNAGRLHIDHCRTKISAMRVGFHPFQRQDFDSEDSNLSPESDSVGPKPPRLIMP